MGKNGLVKKLTAPIGHVATAAGETLREVASTAGNVAKRVINGARKVGNTWVTHTDEALKGVSNNTKKRSRRRGKKTRKSKN
jgi:hypothetical protein